MGRIQIAETQDHFVKDGRPFFYLADTAWSAFTNPSEAEWQEYLDYRRRQGYTAVQINILPQWDRSRLGEHLHPFRRNSGGSYDFTALNEDYFERAARMTQLVVDHGLIPALVLLWCDYVPGTWGSEKIPGHVIPGQALQPYLDYVLRLFRRYEPVYLVSGDTNFPTKETIDYYHTALETVKREDPDALTTLHLWGEHTDVPDRLIESPHLDFYMYQSGHHAGTPQTPYRMAADFLDKKVRRPIVDGEPCYEGHGQGSPYSRFSAFDVRRAIWQSLLSGAKAGVTYGAHGIWSFHKTGAPFPNPSFAGTPFDWKTALRFPGGWDAAATKVLFRRYALHTTEPRNDLLDAATEEIRVAASPQGDRIALYMPYSVELRLNQDFSRHEWQLVELDTGRVACPVVSPNGEGCTVEMPEHNGDMLVIGEAR